MPRPIKASISVAALQHNLARVRSYAPKSSVFAVIKANAYGHGVQRVAPALDSAEGVALLEIDAAVRLREQGYSKRIALLEGVFDLNELSAAAAHDLAIVVHHDAQLRMLDQAPPGARLDVLLKINSGMNRLGFAADTVSDAIAALKTHRAVGRLTLMTHFASADEARGVAWQLEVFERCTAGHALERTLANSAALIRYPATHGDWVRPGIMLYGCTPFADSSAQALGLLPAMTLSSEIISVRDVQGGEYLGYGSAYRSDRRMRIGIVACGYADGYPRHAPTGTPILVAGRRSRTLGRVAMDLLCVDLTALPTAGIGSPVILWGAGLSADEVAQSAGTVSYELLCALSPRVTVVDI